LHYGAHGLQAMRMDSCANWPLFLFLRLTSLQGSLYRKVTIETAPIRDDPSASIDDRNQPLRVPASHHAGAHMQSRVPCDTMPFRIRLCSAAPHSRRRMYKKAPKSPVCHSCSPRPDANTYPASGSPIFPISYHSIRLFLFFFVLI
jgi:hypothetical protein